MYFLLLRPGVEHGRLARVNLLEESLEVRLSAALQQLLLHVLLLVL